MKTFSLSDLAAQVIAEFIQQKPGLSINFEIENNITAFGNDELMKLALRNLIRNAIRNTENKQNPSIVVGQIEGERIYFVMDNGNPQLRKNQNHPHAAFSHITRDSYGIELENAANILVKLGGKLWGVGRQEVGAIYYFCLN